ncbi:MAG: hypothetical protein OEM28_13410 [Nitrosopumilus sp.]|nr:hypothetical protein [Nitrosopumilus sp.]MDH3488804.1 hypothetical protein [Nitrosopumilus sp.]
MTTRETIPDKTNLLLIAESSSKRLFLDPLYHQLVPVVSGTVFQVVVAAWTPDTFPVHEDGAMRAVLLSIGIT